MVNFETERAYTHTIPDLIRDWANPAGLPDTDRAIVVRAMAGISDAFDQMPGKPDHMKRIFVMHFLLKGIHDAGRSGDALPIVSTVINSEPSLLDTAGVQLQDRNIRDLLSDAAHEDINALEAQRSRFDAKIAMLPPGVNYTTKPVKDFSAEIQRRSNFKRKLFEQPSHRPLQERR